jgi:hypothetical protein
MSTFYSKNKAYRDVYEDEYIFNALKNYPAWAKSKLLPSELQIFRNDSTIRKFVNHGSLDKKRLLLAKGGIEMVTIYIDTNKEEPFPLKKFTQLEKQFRTPAARAEIIKSLIEGNMFATSSRDILAAAHLLAQNCHNPYYFVNLDYKRMYNAIDEAKMKNLKRYQGATDNDKITEAEQSRTVVARFMLALQESENYIRVHLKLDDMSVDILLLLFLFRETHVEMSGVYRHLGHYAKKSLRPRMYDLVKAGYVANLKNRKVTSFTIAELGVMAVCELMEKVCNKALVV